MDSSEWRSHKFLIIEDTWLLVAKQVEEMSNSKNAAEEGGALITQNGGIYQQNGVFINHVQAMDDKSMPEMGS